MTDRAKRAAAVAAAAMVETGMRLGIGSGSTVRFFIEALAARRRAETLSIIGVAASEASANRARAAGIPLAEPGPAAIDLAVDGADEIEAGTRRLLKGGGAALLREKIIAQSARRFVIIAEESKVVPVLGTKMPLPVEVDAFGHAATLHRIGLLGGAPKLRPGPRTDGGHLILDCRGFSPIRDPFTLERSLRAIAGVIETGLFLMPVERIILGHDDGSVRDLAP